MKIYIWVIKVMDRVRSRLPWDKYNSGKEESEKSKIWGKKKKKKKKKKKNGKQKKKKKNSAECNETKWWTISSKLK